MFGLGSARVALAFLVVALLWPDGLKPLNWIWFRIGMLMHAVVNPFVLGFLFYLAIWPTGLIMRMLGKDILRLKRQPGRDSYWLPRHPPGPSRDSMKEQF